MKSKPTYEELEQRIRELETVICNTGILQSQGLHRISVPTFVIDSNHEVICWNVAIENLTGLSARDVVGTNLHWQAFYPLQRPTMADFAVDSMHEDVIASFYEGKYRRASHVDAAYEAEDFFPGVGEKGKWLYFTAIPIPDGNGKIIGAVETILDITERKRVEDNLRESEKGYRELSITDSLTKLYNSRHFFKQLKQEAGRASRYKHPLSLILLDIDDFKRYNDSYGHLPGDDALTVLADVIRKNLRVTDTAFRYGGEEFTVILPETHIDEAAEVAERLRKGFESSVLSPLPKLKVCVTASIGVAQYVPSEQLTTFINRVDAAMYKAKQGGKNQVVCEHGGQEGEQIPLFSV